MKRGDMVIYHSRIQLRGIPHIPEQVMLLAHYQHNNKCRIKLRGGTIKTVNRKSLKEISDGS